MLEDYAGYVDPGKVMDIDRAEILMLMQAQRSLETLIEHFPISEPDELPPIKGLYFLIRREYEFQLGAPCFKAWDLSVMYVGISGNLKQRWRSHSLRKVLKARKDFELRWKAHNDDCFENIEHEESTYIGLLRPPLNITMSKTNTQTSDDRLQWLDILKEEIEMAPLLYSRKYQ